MEHNKFLTMHKLIIDISSATHQLLFSAVNNRLKRVLLYLFHVSLNNLTFFYSVKNSISYA